ncbi:MAG: chromosome segregation protein SMC, partial [Candidatus Latescibacterota bacterium]
WLLQLRRACLHLCRGGDRRRGGDDRVLVDTGLGNHTYSIIEREMVDSVISEKDQDKRYLLEEAAGVMRYRIQKEEALRKIAHTENDLARLGDILAELEKELRSLRYQMGKARRYTRLKDKVAVMEAALIKRSLFDLLNEMDEIKREKAHHEGITLADENEITVREDKLQESRIESSELERKLQDVYENRHKLSQSLQQDEERIAILTERIGSNENRIREDEEEVERSRSKLTSLSEELLRFNRLIEEKEKELKEEKIVLGNTEDSLRTVTLELDAVKNQVRDKKQLALDLVREKERVRGIREHLRERLHELAAKKEALSGEIEALRNEQTALNKQLEESGKRAEENRRSLSGSNMALESVTCRSERTLNLIARCEESGSKATIEFNRFKEKKEFLERIKGESTHYSRKDFTRNSRIKGILADHVRVDKRYRKCFEACLSPVLQALLTDSKEDAFKCLEDIRVDGNGGGKVQLLYPNGNGDYAYTHAGGDPGTRALDVLDGDTGVKDYLTPYLADVFVTEDVTEALNLLETDPDIRVVTIDGVFFDGPGRIVVAGSDEIEMTLLEFGSKIEELTASMERCNRRVDRLRDRKTGLEELRTRLGEDAGRLRVEVRAAERESDTISEERRRQELALVRVREKIASISAARTESEETTENIRARLQSLPEPVDDRDKEDMLDDGLTELERNAVRLEREKESLAESAAKIRLNIATITGEITTAAEKRKNVEMLVAELKELIVYREDDAKRCRTEIETAKTEITDARGRIAGSHGVLEKIEKEIEEAKGQHERVQERCTTLETELKEFKDQRDQKKENVQRCTIEIVARETRIKDLLEKARENFNQDLEPFTSDRTQFDPTEWEELDFDSLEELRAKLETFGPVNMLALDEFKEKKERFDFLSKQKLDLEEAKESLTQAIRRINREARRRLNDTFEKVRVNFKKTFDTLFDGGEADLLFVDSDDPLEANIRLVANPKGKRLHDISSLSGGERALVALSLLFAIYLVKPSPFCVFDEVDAPLDDANIARFVRLLKSFTDKTQFIVITHNKKTMEAADYLYGVTMEEPGVSKMISVHIGEVDRFRETNGSHGGAVVTEPTEEVPVHT